MKKTIAILGVAMLALTACEPTQSTSTTNARAVEANQKTLQTAIPAPRLTTSLERKNLVERLERINQQNMSGFIYLISQGQVMASYPVRGKVTSLKAYLMAGETAHSVQGNPYTLEQPDYDGAYGQNAEGIFFFTADTNAYVEWAGEYLFSDQPLSLNTEPRMVYNVQE
jgi:hypothetical protein